MGRTFFLPHKTAAEKQRLIQDAAKCAKLIELFRGRGAKVSMATVSQASDDTGPSNLGQTIHARTSGCVGSGCNFEAHLEL